MVSFEGVSFRYDGSERDSLTDCSFEIKKGEFVLLCGRSGSGKTTVTKLINGLIPEFAPGKKRGRVEVDGCVVGETPLWELSRRVGSVFQNPKAQFFNLNSTDEIVFGMENLGYERGFMQERFDKTVESCKVSGLLDKNLFQLSGGEKQKIAIASVYAMNGEVFLLDEPSSNLDIESMKNLGQVLKTLKEEGKTVIIAEHRLWYIAALVDRAFYFRDSRLERVWSGEELRRLGPEECVRLGLRCTKRRPLCAEECGYDETEDLRAEGLCLSYGRKIVQRDLTFSAGFGDVVAVLGANGAGKSTLIKCLCGLKKESGGQIFLQGRRLTPKMRRREAFLIMQDVNHQLFSDTALGEAMLGNGCGEEEARETLAGLGLDGYERRHPMALSGGQAQRLAVADACLSGRRLLIFDEPTSGLDRDGMWKVAGMLKRLAGQGRLILVVTHDEELVASVCTKVLRLTPVAGRPEQE